MIINDLFSEMHKLNTPEPRYDIIFHLPPKIEPVEDGIRSPEQFDPEWRAQADVALRSLFVLSFRPKLLHTVKSVTMDDRIKECLAIIQDRRHKHPYMEHAEQGSDTE
jgi:hypothetical protein